MAHEELTTLYQHLQETQFSFAPRGRHHLHDIYSSVKEQYPELCDDSYLCSENCKQGHNSPEWQHRVRAALDSLKRRSPIVQPDSEHGFWQFVENSTNELQRRQSIWRELENRRHANPLSPTDLRELGVYGGAQGIWVDKSRTSSLANDGVTVSVLHTGSSYDDDLSDDCVIYHYPTTNRPASRDESEINATKNAARFRLPVFVVTYPSPSSKFREVHLAWVEDWDDKSRVFLISFGNSPPTDVAEEDNGAFQITSETKAAASTRVVRPSQQRFKFEVFKRYGPSCAFCDLDVPETLDAAHLCPKSKRGSDDPRNGLVHCATHHRAFDARHVGIEPEQLTIEVSDGGPTLTDLRITRTDLQHLPNAPHREALSWCWERFTKENGR